MVIEMNANTHLMVCSSPSPGTLLIASIRVSKSQIRAFSRMIAWLTITVIGRWVNHAPFHIPCNGSGAAWSPGAIQQGYF